MFDIHAVLIRKFLFPVMERLRGNRTLHYVNEMKAMDTCSAEQLKQRQSERLARLLARVTEEVPAYQKFHAALDMDEPFESLKQFPVLTKDRFMRSTEAWINPALKAHAIRNRTGGSTGQPVQFFMDRVTVEHYEAARWRGLSWWDIRPGDRSVMIWGSPIELEQQAARKQQLREHLLKNRTMLSSYDLSPDRLDDYLAHIERMQPRYLYGYASALSQIALWMLEQNRTLSNPLHAIVSTADMLRDVDRQRIQAAFNCPVINEYGARDAGIIAFECPYGSLHIQEENLVLEVLDPDTMTPLPEGDLGLLAVTDLWNEVQPRLRYVVGDLGAISPEPCPCGRPQAVLEQLAGRFEEMLQARDGRKVHGHFVTHVLRDLPA